VEIAQQPAIPTVPTVAWKSAEKAFFEISINSGGLPHSHTCDDGFLIIEKKTKELLPLIWASRPKMAGSEGWFLADLISLWCWTCRLHGGPAIHIPLLEKNDSDLPCL
jgi:hypothetical protein